MITRPSIRRLARSALVAAAVPLTILATSVSASASPGDTVSSNDTVRQFGVSFTVQNVNRSAIECAADGKTYTVRGHITAPVQSFTDPQAVTVLLHGLSYGEFFGNFDAVPGYNFAESQAMSGHTTVTIDRLGYGSSGKPAGKDICFGSRADIAHQIVQQLRAGSYTVDGIQSPKFRQVVLAGHSVGGLIAQAEAYSFGDIDGLMVLSYSDTDVSPAAKGALAVATQECQAGGQKQDGTTGPEGYVYFGAQTPEKFIEAHFYVNNADPSVVDATAGLRSRDPCGDVLSYKTAAATNLKNLSKISVPTLVLIGGADAIYPVTADKQAGLLTGSTDVTAVTIPLTGHAVALHRTADLFSSDVAGWLAKHDFGGWAMPVGAPNTGGGSTAAQGPAGDTGRAVLLTTGMLSILAAAAVLFRRRAHR
ncbi:alpha/beta hydrolase [Nakamurella sp. A5-74]|uniref:Alpha/beta hydrolase n=1 Tax=Nakamurella sp. A5-74 TaxID=3158264 RepID=A0AAU8DSL3_9ACTN